MSIKKSTEKDVKAFKDLTSVMKVATLMGPATMKSLRDYDPDYDLEDEEDFERPNDHKIIDLTEGNRLHIHVVSKTFNGFEKDIVRFCLTNMANKYAKVGEILYSDCQGRAGTTMVDTAYKESTKVYDEMSWHCKVKGHNVYVQSNYHPQTDTYTLNFSSTNEEACNKLVNKFYSQMEKSNFYKGKNLKLTKHFEFIKPIETTEAQCILDDDIKKELKMNIIDFLSDPKMHEVVKKRGIIMHGAPGCGKTSSIKYIFHELSKNNVTCLFLTDESINKNSIDMIFHMINKYLAPVVVVMEDVDLFLGDRDSERSPLLGTMLSVMNGLEDMVKPIVFLSTTNRIEILDKAMTRPCRIDRKIKVDYPSEENLNRIFEALSGTKLDKNIFKQDKDDKKKLTGAHIQETVNTARLLSQAKNKKFEDCVEEAVEIIKKNFFIGQSEGTMGFKQ